jgi:uncharacterized protein YfaS (alpha-2-macroglobulin family)
MRFATYFFTDRSIYRPGQTIYFKGIVLETDGQTSHIKTGIKSTVALYDVNSQKIADLQLTTNEYGTFMKAVRVIFQWKNTKDQSLR